MLLQNLFKTNKRYKLYYFGGSKNKNAGDVFNVDLMKYFGIKYVRNRKIQNSNLICVGSHLDILSLSSKSKLIIAGCGFMTPPQQDDCINREIEVMALRGALSKVRIEELTGYSLENCILGDPGLLISKIYPMNHPKKYKVGVIPHYYDKTEWDARKINIKGNNFRLIDIQQEAKDVAKELCECECILSSSLHGLIFADSYNIPNRQLIMSDKVSGGSYKFKDYYSAFNLELPKAIDIRNEIIDDDAIINVITSYTKKDVETKQIELTNVYKNLKNKLQ